MKSSLLVFIALALCSPLFLAPSQPENHSGKKCYLRAESVWIVDNNNPRCTKVYFNGDLGLVSVFPGPGSKLTVTVREGDDPLFRTFCLDFGSMKTDGICWLGRNPENLYEMARETGWRPPKKQEKTDAEEE